MLAKVTETYPWERQKPYYVTHTWNLNKDEFTDAENRLVVGRGRAGDGQPRVNMVKRYKLLVIK